MLKLVTCCLQNMCGKAFKFKLDCITGTSDEPSSEDSMTNKESKIKKTINRVRAMKITTIQCLLYALDCLKDLFCDTVKHKVIHDSVVKNACQTKCIDVFASSLNCKT